MNEIQRVYSKLGFAFSDQSEATMIAENARSTKQKHGQHRTQISNFASD